MIKDSIRHGDLALHISIFLLFAALLLSTPIAVAEEAGKVVSLLGRAEILREGHWQPLQVGAAIAVGELIKTAEGSRMAVQLTNGSQLKLNANSQLELKPPTAKKIPTSTEHFLQKTFRLLGGEIWVRGTQNLEVETIAATATIRGTEFNLAVESSGVSRLAVLEGAVEFHNPYGRVWVAAHEQATAKKGEAPRKMMLVEPLDAVQWSLYYPTPPLDRTSQEKHRTAPGASDRWLAAAHDHLLRGEVPQAQQALDWVLALDPHDARAYSLRAIIDLVQNRKTEARANAERAVAADPASSVAYLTLSWTQQAEFDLDGALASARQAVAFDPDSPHALTQESRLLFGMGEIKPALQAAERARQRAPNDALVNSTWGFLQLAQGHTEAAKQAFEDAIAQDSTLGEPHLGLGLALFRQNQAKAAVTEIEKATLLEPKVSLYNSYLGKAYFEIKDDRLAQKYLAQAKALDSRDPTPYFYDAIHLQSINRPIEAVQNLQKSIELNDNRAVYRSRLLLDEDIAARTAALGKIYSELGFEQLGLREGGQSLTSDPTNHSAHRLLADSYLFLSKHEIARVSELLQSQLLQPINISPVQPRLAEANLYNLGSFGPSVESLYEYDALFVRNRPVVSVNGIAGNNNTLGDEIIVFGIADRFSYSLGQAHYQTDGTIENADLQYNLYNIFTQVAITPQLNLQIEYRRRETRQGSLSLGPNLFDENGRRQYQQDTGRLGMRYSLSPGSDVLLSLIYTGIKDDFYLKNIPSFNSHSDIPGYQAEAQYLFRTDRFNLVAGGGITYSDLENTVLSEGVVSPDPISISERMVTSYLYGNLNWPEDIFWTMGLGYGGFKRNGLDLASDFLPKLGVRWTISDDFSVRAAYLQTVKRTLVTNQTIEPTQVAGFNQFFDDLNGTQASLYGVGLDGKLSGQIWTGLEVLSRDLDIPVLNAENNILRGEWNEYSYRVYLYWMINRHLAASVEFDLEKFERKNNTTHNYHPERMETFKIPFSVQYSDPSGFFTKLGATYIKQNAEGPLAIKRGEEFVVVDTAIGYRLPKRWGLLSLEIRNLLDQSFYLVDDSFRNASDFTGLQANAQYAPDRSILASIRLNF